MKWFFRFHNILSGKFHIVVLYTHLSSSFQLFLLDLINKTFSYSLTMLSFLKLVLYDLSLHSFLFYSTQQALPAALSLNFKSPHHSNGFTQLTQGILYSHLCEYYLSEGRHEPIPMQHSYDKSLCIHSCNDFYMQLKLVHTFINYVHFSYYTLIVQVKKHPCQQQ